MTTRELIHRLKELDPDEYLPVAFQDEAPFVDAPIQDWFLRKEDIRRVPGISVDSDIIKINRD